MNEQQKLELILHLAHCERCRTQAYRRYRLRHLLGTDTLRRWFKGAE